MLYENLSTLGATYVIETEGEHGPEYWKGGMDFTDSINDATRYGVANAQRFILYLERRAIRTKAVKVPGQYTIMHWPGLGWVVLNNRDEGAKVHRVRRVSGDGAWYFNGAKNDILVVRYNTHNNDHYQVTFDGDQIQAVTHFVDGQALNEFTSFPIEGSSNLKYLFEFESQAAEDLEVD